MRLRNLPEWQQDLVITASSVAIGVLLYLIGWYPLFETNITPPGWVRPALFAGICVLELFRRRAPIPALVLGIALLVADAFFGVSMAMLIVFADLLYAATLYGPRRISQDMIPITAFTTIIAIIGALVFTPDLRATIVTGLAALPFLVVPVWWATNIRQHQEIASAERRNALQLAKISELDQRAAIAAERARMARDLHDVIAGHLSAIAIQSEAALSINNADPETARSVLTAVRENSVRALEEMRAMIELLRADGSGQDETTAPAGLGELSTLVESARASGMLVEVHSEIDDLEILPAAVNLTAYRIAQEALTNAMKHAPQSRARVEVRQVDGALTVEVVNELSGTSPQPNGTGTGAGLINMRERAAAVGGSLAAGPSESEWLVRAVLPVVRP